MKIHEKIKLLRSHLNMTMKDFARATNINFNTLRAIEQRGSIPRADVLEKIVKFRPGTAEFLLTENCDFKTDFNVVYNVIDIVDPRFMNTTIVKHSAIQQIVFCQSIEDENQLCVFFIIEKDDFIKRSEKSYIKNVVFADVGSLSLVSRGGGMLALQELKRWVKKVNIDLLKTADFNYAHQEKIDEVRSRLSFFTGDFQETLTGEFLIIDQFYNWKESDSY